MGPRTLRLQRPGGIALEIAERGATWLSCDVPLADATRRDVILRREIDDASADSAFIGATVGRYANRIAHGRIAQGEQQWQLETGGARHQLHGGPQGFHARDWNATQLSDSEAMFTLHSPAGDQGYPGDLDVVVSYRLPEAMTIEMEVRAVSSAATPLAITNHAYFNLDGGASDVRRHTLEMRAAQWMPVDAELIPTGGPIAVAGTAYDFRVRKPFTHDYDHAFLLDESCMAMRATAVKLWSSNADLRLAIATTMPAVQVYTGQYLHGNHLACSGVAIEPGWLPDSPNHPEWPQPSCWLQPREAVRHVIRWCFCA